MVAQHIVTLQTVRTFNLTTDFAGALRVAGSWLGHFHLGIPGNGSYADHELGMICLMRELALAAKVGITVPTVVGLLAK